MDVDNQYYIKEAFLVLYLRICHITSKARAYIEHIGGASTPQLSLEVVETSTCGVSKRLMRL